VEIKGDPVRVIEKVGVIRVCVEVDERLLDPPQVPDKLPGIAPSRHLGRELESHRPCQEHREESISEDREKMIADCGLRIAD
jgi:hypothetical protein